MRKTCHGLSWCEVDNYMRLSSLMIEGVYLETVANYIAVEGCL